MGLALLQFAAGALLSEAVMTILAPVAPDNESE